MRPWEREELEEIEYEPTSVREILTEMKDVAELIVDLAYSALLLDDEDIAEEVRFLEAHMDTLNYRIRLMSMLAARSVEEAEQLTGILQVASATEHLSNAAGDIVSLLDEGETRPFVPRLLARGDEQIKPFRVPDGSTLDGSSLADASVETETGMRVIAIRRGEHWQFGPKGSATVRAADVLLLRGSQEGFERFQALSRGEPLEHA